MAFNDANENLSQQTQPPPFQPNAIWMGAALVALVVIASLVGVFSKTNGPEGTNENAFSPADATLAYWQRLTEIGGDFVMLVEQQQQQPPATPEEWFELAKLAKTQVDDIKHQLLQLPVLGVDPDAIEIGSQTLELFGEAEIFMADLENLINDAMAFNEQSTSVAKLAESAMRGLLGDPLGTFNEMQADQTKLKVRYQQMVEQIQAFQRKANLLDATAHRTRAELTARYGVEFPPGK